MPYVPYQHSPGRAPFKPPPKPPAKKPPPRKTPGPAVPIAAPPPPPQFQGQTPDQILAKAREMARLQQQGSYASIAAQQAYAQQVMQAHMAQQQSVWGGVKGLLGGIGSSVQDTFNQGAKAQSAFGQGYAHGMKLLTQGQADSTNTYLKDVVGAPEGQQIPASQATDASGVVGIVGGDIPAEQFKMQGAAYKDAAASFPMQADAQQNMAKIGIEQEYAQDSAAFARQLQDLARENPLVVAEYLDELYTQQRADRNDFLGQQEDQQKLAYAQQQDREQKATTLYNSGMITQRQLAQELGLPNPNRYPNQPKSSGSSLSETKFAYQVAKGQADTFTKNSDHVYVARQTKGGGWQVVDAGPKLAEKTKPLKPGTKVGAYYIGVDGKQHLSPDYKLGPDGTPQKRYKPNAPKAPTDISMPLSKAARKWVDGKGRPLSPERAAVLGPPPKPDKKATTKPPTAPQIKAGWKIVTDSYYHAIGTNRRLTIPEIDRKIKQTNASRLNAWKQADPTKRPPNPPAPLARADISRMTPAQKRLMGIAGVERPAQDVYVDLVHAGVPPRRAWRMVRKYYPGFGKGYFS